VPETAASEEVIARIPISGRDYIEKIVQLPFSLPPLERLKVQEFIKNEYSDLASCARACAAGLEANPRKVKRTLNLLRLLLSLAPDSTDPTLLAKIVVIQNRYPDLYVQLFDYPSLLQELERYYRQSGDILPPPEGDYQQQTLHKLRDMYTHLKALGDMLRLEPFFKDLSRQQIESYLYLTRATSEDKQIVQVEASPTPLWERLRSGDLTQIHDALERIRAAGQSGEYETQMTAMFERAELPPRERLSLGLAWGRLVYPDDLDEGVPVPNTSFQLGKYPVTNQQFRRFVEDGGYQKPAYWEEEWEYVPTVKKPKYWDNERWSQPGQPVVGISWYEARAYCRWLSQHKGRACRLPTGEEWTRVATGLAKLPANPAQVPAYPWGPEFEVNRANTSESGLGVTTPVGCYPRGASPAGALDMSGNIWEWLADDGHQMGSKAMRGGSWREGADRACWDAREDALPTFRSDSVGFRVLYEA